jgi:diguanylate cyclase (GGDEF)-like protein
MSQMSRNVVALCESTVESMLKSTAFDRLPLPAACVNSAGQMLAVNSAFGVLLGRSLDQIISKPLFDFVGPQQRAGLARRWVRFWQRLQRTSTARGVMRLHRAESAPLEVRVDAQLLTLAGEKFALLAVCDISAPRAEHRQRRRQQARNVALALAENPAFLLDLDGRVIDHNPAAASIKPDSMLDLVGLPFDDLLDEASAEEFRRDFAAVRADEGVSVTRELRLRSRGGGRPMLGQVQNLRRPGLAATRVVLRDAVSAAMQSASESARQARRLEFRDRLLALAIEPRREFSPALSQLLRVAADTLNVSAAGFWSHDGSSARLRCESMFLRQQSRFVHDWAGVEFPPELYPVFMADLRERRPLAIGDLSDAGELSALAVHRRFSSVRALLSAPVLVDGNVRGVLILHDDAPRRWDEDEIGFASTSALMIALAMEAAHRQQAESRIEQLAWYDALTGLPNRNLLREILRDMVTSAAGGRQRIALMLIDLDRFKDVNDTLGHLVGDSLIKSAAQALRDSVGGRGVVGRLGGDEFVVVLNDFEHRQQVSQFAARLTQSLHRTDLVPNIDTQVSASIGIALFPEHGREVSTLMKNADAAMYQAKRDGRNQFSFFNPIRYEHAAREVQLGIQLLKALHGRAAQFLVEYQPQVDMASGRVVGLEALIRWQHPSYGRLTPDRFIGVAEASGLSERISSWLIGEVCAQILRWRARQPGFDIPIAINVAGRELGSASLPSIVRSTLQQYRVDPSMIMLEITERTLVRLDEVHSDVMAELAAIGVGLVLDDFGTGYSMLGYLKRMPIQALKIDGSFVEGVPDDPDSCAIVHAVLAVARHFRLKVIAEGIETAAQVEYLRTVGCEYAQGFYYAHPLLPQEILDHIERGLPSSGARPPG